MTEKLKVYVPPHPLIQNWLTMAREASTPPVLFRTAMTELGRWLTYEAIRDWLPTQDVSVQSPLAPAQGRLIRSDIPLAIVPILRAGLALLPGMQDVLPRCRHLSPGNGPRRNQPRPQLLPQQTP